MSNIAESLRPFERAARQIKGWRFEYEPEAIGEDVPWNYLAIASNLAAQSNRVVDLGTGGGETYSHILNNLGVEAFATEEWERNAPVAAARLMGAAPVARCSSFHLPFQDETFDLVLSRHEAIDPSEIVRVLNQGGRFLSQQVIHDFMFELKDVFPDTTIFPNFFKEYQKVFSDLGLQVLRAEEFRYKIRFQELGHLVYQLVVAPWTLPAFTVTTHIEGLMLLDDMLSRGEALEFTAGYSLLEVEKGF